jgi:hypothetical protein
VCYIMKYAVSNEVESILDPCLNYSVVVYLSLGTVESLTDLQYIIPVANIFCSITY